MNDGAALDLPPCNESIGSERLIVASYNRPRIPVTIRLERTRYRTMSWCNFSLSESRSGAGLLFHHHCKIDFNNYFSGVLRELYNSISRSPRRTNLLRNAPPGAAALAVPFAADFGSFCGSVCGSEGLTTLRIRTGKSCCRWGHPLLTMSDVASTARVQLYIAQPS